MPPRLLFGGIVGDTGRFLFPRTTDKTFLYAAELIRYNFPRSELFDKMYELEPNIVKLNGYIMQNFEQHNNGVAAVRLTKELMEEYSARPAEASLLVGALENVKGIKAWVFFIEETDEIRVRLRSKGPVINGVARKFKGGGHPLASGATLYSWEEVEAVVKELESVCAEE